MSANGDPKDGAPKENHDAAQPNGLTGLDKLKHLLTALFEDEEFTGFELYDGHFLQLKSTLKDIIFRREDLDAFKARMVPSGENPFAEPVKRQKEMILQSRSREYQREAQAIVELSMKFSERLHKDSLMIERVVQQMKEVWPDTADLAQ